MPSHLRSVDCSSLRPGSNVWRSSVHALTSVRRKLLYHFSFQSRDGQALACASWDRTCRVWQITTQPAAFGTNGPVLYKGNPQSLFTETAPILSCCFGDVSGSPVEKNRLRRLTVTARAATITHALTICLHRVCMSGRLLADNADAVNSRM